MPLGQRFDAQKAIEAILYIATRVQNPSFHRIAKVLYFADKQKLAAYGALVLGDEYVAMKHGPVPSGVYDILKSVRGDGGHAAGGRAAQAFDVVDRCLVTPKRDPNLDYLSTADLRCLNQSILEYGGLKFDELSRRSHDSAWIAADENDLMSLEDIARATSQPEAALAAVHGCFDSGSYAASVKAARKASC
jgi:uncharacterized phage-associated protein